MTRNVDWRGYAAAVLAALACTAIGWLMRGRFDLVNIAMVYLLAVVLVALRYARGPAIAAALCCVVASTSRSCRRRGGSPSTTCNTSSRSRSWSPWRS